jgi:hypothetical protein
MRTPAIFGKGKNIYHGWTRMNTDISAPQARHRCSLPFPDEIQLRQERHHPFSIPEDAAPDGADDFWF